MLVVCCLLPIKCQTLFVALLLFACCLMFVGWCVLCVVRAECNVARCDVRCVSFVVVDCCALHVMSCLFVGCLLSV